MELTDFLLARIADDEREWSNAAFAPVAGQGLSRLVLKTCAECEAKRKIVKEYAKAAEEATNTLTVDDQFDSGTEFGLGVALRLLALPHADHPDYRQEWAP